MKLKALMKRTGAVLMSAAMLCTAAAVLPPVTNTGIVANASEISDEQYRNDTSLVKFKIDEGVTYIGSMAFFGCKNLEKVVFSSTVKHIGDHAFWGCKNLSDVQLNEGLISIGRNAFEGDSNFGSSLNKIILPNTLETIDSGAFRYSGLKTIYIPSSVKSIADSAFQGCGKIKIYGTKNSTKAKAYVSKQKAQKNCQTEYTDVDFIEIGVKMSKSQMTLGKGETTKLSASISPLNIINKSTTWRTSDSKVLTVDQKGNVKAMGNGTAWITAYVPGYNDLTASCKITVKNAPTKITLTKGIVTIGVGEKFTLGSSVPDGTACSKRTYRTSNSSIVKMTRTDWQGDFVGVKPGVAYVTVRSYNGKESTCKVTVKKAPSSVAISKKNLTLKVGQTATLSSSIPSDAGCAARTFRSSDSLVVKMTKTNWTGSFKAVKPGTAYVTVRIYNGKEASCKVTVVK